MDTGRWSVPLRVESVHEGGGDFTLTADGATRAALAREAGVIAFPSVEAKFHVEPYRRNGLRVTGTVTATVRQTCVVTMDEIEGAISEPIEITFDPSADDRPLSGEEDRHPDDPEPPEPLAGDSIDLGAIATEFLLLGVDPYPRKAGVVFDAPAPASDENPFAALAALKNKSAKP
ncbi:MAG: DUF177 domain-containing protein [Rhizobiales bacterium]|nr:DUF177 domain-containing protein [Hyphomicrobiales bacterium]